MVQYSTIFWSSTVKKKRYLVTVDGSAGGAKRGAVLQAGAEAEVLHPLPWLPLHQDDPADRHVQPGQGQGRHHRGRQEEEEVLQTLSVGNPCKCAVKPCSEKLPDFLFKERSLRLFCHTLAVLQAAKYHPNQQNGSSV